MRTRPPRPTRTDTLFPYTTLFRSLDLILNPAALGLVNQPCWRFSIPLPARKPFREAKLRIDGGKPGRPVKDDLLSLLADARSEEHTSELQSLMRISYAVFCLKKKKKKQTQNK